MTRKTRVSEPDEPDISLADFCRELSMGLTRVELISAFLTTEAHAGRVSASRSVLQDRFMAFTHAPADAGASRGIS